MTDQEEAVQSIETERGHVYLSTSIVPPHPGPAFTRFVCLSDTHSNTRVSVPPGDVLLHSGDLLRYGTLPELRKAIQWLKELPHPVKIVIAGNHDYCLDREWFKVHGTMTTSEGLTIEHDIGITSEDVEEATELMRREELANAGLHYLQFESFDLKVPGKEKTWRVFGSPGSPRFSGGAFQYYENEAEEVYQRIPDDVEILLTHTPPYRMLDVTRAGNIAGCRHLLSRIQSLKACKLHVWGHIHEARGAGIMEDGRICVNAAARRPPEAITVDLKD